MTSPSQKVFGSDWQRLFDDRDCVRTNQHLAGSLEITMYGHPQKGYLMPLSNEDKAALAELVSDYNKLAKSMFPMPSQVLEISSKIINLLALAAGVNVERE
jgi:hypothetical protein